MLTATVLFQIGMTDCSEIGGFTLDLYSINTGYLELHLVTIQIFKNMFLKSISPVNTTQFELY